MTAHDFKVGDDSAKDGSFQRVTSQFRDWIKADGSTNFAPEANRYHLYISYACPWACRCLLVLKLKGLDHIIGVTTVDWFLQNRGNGWRFGHEGDEEPLFPDEKMEYLRQIYNKSTAPAIYEGRVTVPVLFDKKTNKIVSNESSEIIEMLNSEFNNNGLAKNPSLDLYPSKWKKEIDELNEWVYNTVNNGVYKCGFATQQKPYEQAYQELFASLERLDDILDKKRFLFSNDQLTMADVRLFTTLVRFDTVYHTHFKCNWKLLTQFKNLHKYTMDIYQMPGVKETVNMRHIKYHYYMSHDSINPNRLVPPFEQTFEGDSGRATRKYE